VEFFKKLIASPNSSAMPVKIHYDQNEKRDCLQVFFDQSADEQYARHIAGITLEALRFHNPTDAASDNRYTVSLEPRHDTMVLKQILSFAGFVPYASEESHLPSHVKKRLKAVAKEYIDVKDFYEGGFAGMVKKMEEHAQHVQVYLPSGDTPTQSAGIINHLQEKGFLTDISHKCLHEVVAAFESAYQQQCPVNVKALKIRLEAMLPRIAAISQGR
jgi:hypothetical protein